MAEVPPCAVVTVMSTVPGACGGAVTVICVGELTEKLTEAPPKDTAVTPLKFVPGVEYAQQGDQSATTITMRGIGNDSAFTELDSPEVATYVNGI